MVPDILCRKPKGGWGNWGTAIDFLMLVNLIYD
ncbi:hypothetical protein [Caudoviricetes sp.]|nr:hypothetical protein [Caudoviricetes sp.]